MPIKKTMRNRSNLIIFCVLIILFGIVNVNAGDFSSDTLLIKEVVKSGGEATKELTITSENSRSVSVKFLSNTDFLTLSESQLDIAPGTPGIFTATLNSENLDPGVYFGKIEIKTDHTLTIPAIFEIESENLLFDVISDTSKAFSIVNPGDVFGTTVNVVSFNAETEDVVLQLFISNLDSVLIYSAEENLQVSNLISTTFSFKLTDDAEPGIYVISALVTATSNGITTVGTSSDIFEIVREPTLSPWGVLQKNVVDRYLLFVAVAILFLVLAFLVFNVTWKRRLTYISEAHEIVKQMKDTEIESLKKVMEQEINTFKMNKRIEVSKVKHETHTKYQEIVDEKDRELEKLRITKEKNREIRKIEIEAVTIKLHKLERQKSLLEEALQSNFIKKESYDKSIEKIDKLISSLKKRL